MNDDDVVTATLLRLRVVAPFCVRKVVDLGFYEPVTVCVCVCVQ